MSSNGPSKYDKDTSRNDTAHNVEKGLRARSNSGPILRLLERRKRSLDDLETDKVGLTSPRSSREGSPTVTSKKEKPKM